MRMWADIADFTAAWLDIRFFWQYKKILFLYLWIKDLDLGLEESKEKILLEKKRKQYFQTPDIALRDDPFLWFYYL